MNQADAGKLVYMALANFPGMHEKGIDWKDTARLWSLMLSDIPYELGEQALVRVLSRVRFFPAIAEMRAAISEIVEPELITPEHAWQMAWNSVGNLDGLPDDVHLIARYFNMNKPMSSDPQAVSVLRSQFVAAYKRERKEYREYIAIPGKISREAIETASGSRLALAP